MELFHFCYDTVISYQNVFSWLTFDQGYGKWRQKSHGKEAARVCVSVCVHVFECECVYVHVCCALCVYMCMVFMRESMLYDFVCVVMCMCVHVCCVCISVYARMHVYIQVVIYVSMSVCVMCEKES